MTVPNDCVYWDRLFREVNGKNDIHYVVMLTEVDRKTKATFYTRK